MRNVITSERPYVRLLIVAAISMSLSNGPLHAQSLEDVLDDDVFLRGLSEYEFPELIEHYFQQHRPEDETAAFEQQLALDRMMLRDRAHGTADRERIVQRMLERRERAIEEVADSQRRAILLTDQASDVYFELLGLDATTIVSLFGLPGEDQRQRAADGARRLYETALRAESAIDEALLDLEIEPDFMHDPALRERRRQLASRQRDRRVPFFLGIGATLHAVLNVPEGHEQTRLLSEAARVLEPLPQRLEGALAAHARLYEAIIERERGNVQAARNHFRSARDETAAEPIIALAAYLGEVMLLRDEGALGSALRVLEQAADDRRVPDELFFHLLIADQRALVHQAEVEQGRRDTAAAFDAYLTLLDEAPRSQQDYVRQAVFDRLRRVEQHDVDVDAMPLLVRIAQYDRLGDDSARRDEAIAAMRSIMDSRALDDREHELAVFVLARLLQRAGQMVEAGANWVEYSRLFPYSRESERAIERGVSLLAEAYRENPGQAAKPLREGLELLLDRYSASGMAAARLDHWRYIAGRLALHEGRHNDAERHFNRIDTSAPHWPDARFMLIETIRAREQHGELLDLLGGVRDALRSAMDDVRDGDRRAQLERYLTLITFHEAEAHLRMEEPSPGRSLEILERLEESAFGDDAALTAQWLQLRIDALEALERRDEARELLVQFIEHAPERAASVLQPMLRSLQQRVDWLLVHNRPEEAQRIAERDMVPLAQVIEDWAGHRGAAATPWSLRVGAADAYRHAGRYEQALDAYERLQREHPSTAALLLGRAECLYHLAEDANDPRLAEAMQLYRRIASGGERLGHDVYWLAQLRTLQVLERSGRNVHQIAPQVERLRQHHPELGGDRYRREFDRLQRDHS